MSVTCSIFFDRQLKFARNALFQPLSDTHPLLPQGKRVPEVEPTETQHVVRESLAGPDLKLARLFPFQVCWLQVFCHLQQNPQERA